jgi:hypothetical protein
MLSRAGRSGVVTDEGGHPLNVIVAPQSGGAGARPPVVPVPPVLPPAAGRGLPIGPGPMAGPPGGPGAGLPMAPGRRPWPAGPRTAAQAWRPHSRRRIVMRGSRP